MLKNIFALISSFLFVLFTGLVIFVATSHADEFLDDGFFSLQQVKVSYIHMLDGVDPLIPDTNIHERLNLGLDTNLLTYGFWNSKIESATDEDQFRYVGLMMNLGVHVTDFLDVSLYHHSQHVLDTDYTLPGGFPTEDGIELDLYLFSKTRKNVGLF